MSRKVLMIVLDQFRADLLHGPLAAYAPTPNLDALAAGATVFRNHHTVAMPCGPARASLLTGQYAMNHRAVRNGTPLSDRLPNLATAARQIGVEPLLFGYTDTQPDPAALAERDPANRSYTGPMRGFREVVEMREEAWRWLAHLRRKGYDAPEAGAADFQRLYRPTTGALGGPALYRAEDSDTAFLTDETIAALDVRKQEEWLAFVGFIRPHPPFIAPAPYHALIDPGSLPLPDRSGLNDRPEHPFVQAYFSGPSARDMFWRFDGDHGCLVPETVAKIRATYLGLVAEIDHHVGRLLDWLERSGLAGETLVVVTADHGEMLGDFGMWGKLTPFRAASHVPLLIRDPLAGKACAIEDLTASIDVAPTILDWLGDAAPREMNGVSLANYMKDEASADGRSSLMIEFELGEPEAPTRFERAWGLPASQCGVAVLETGEFRYAHFAGGLPCMAFGDPTEPDPLLNPSSERVAAGARRLLDHRMANAETA